MFADIPEDALFQTDVTGSTAIQQQVRKAHPQLKADEIIAQRSAVPAVSSRKRAGTAVTDGIVPAKKRRGPGVSSKELLRLKGIAYGGDGVHKDVVAAEGDATYDPWAVVEVPKPTYDQSFLPGPDVRREPKTLKEAPITLTATGRALPNVRLPAGGRSYNPAFDDWSALLEKEGLKEVEKEKKRRADAAAEEERQARIAAAAEEAERAEERAALSEYDESEWEGFQSDYDEVTLKKKRPERMTPSERNKAKRRKEAERLAKHESRMKARDEQLKQLHHIKKEMVAKENDRKTKALAKFPGSVESEDSMEEEDGEVLRKRRFNTKHPIPDAPLELVLPDELQDSLRRLKPEGNLLSDRYRNMLVQGRIENRKTKQWRQRNEKATVKWSHKDWRLDQIR